jgi:DNA replication and repair protein RecF
MRLWWKDSVSLLLKQLRLENFRNYVQLTIDIEKPIVIFVGHNAQGKTNLLEAIYTLALTRSHRTANDRELIRWNEEFAILQTQVMKKYGPCELSIQLSKQGKRAKVNHLSQRKLSEYLGHLNVVMFAPEDLDIVKGSPVVRRRFVDMELAQVNPSYLYDLNQYQRALEQKNNLLKALQLKGATKDDMLTLWNEQVAQYAVKIIQKRTMFINQIAAWAKTIHAGISDQKEMLEIRYLCSQPLSNDSDETVLIRDYMVKLDEIQEKEIRRGSAQVGPHRDDLHFFINQKEVQTYGSQGQQRTTALSLKLAEIELIHSVTGEYPLLLLDDVLSELDEIRQTQLIDIFKDKVQTFITTTSIAAIDLDKINQFEIFDVADGMIARRGD